MRNAISRPRRIEYRGTSILIDVQESLDGVFGHADLFARSQFKGRLSLGSRCRGREEVQNELESLARAKVDVQAAIDSVRRHSVPNASAHSPPPTWS
jgi:hypothetical protein